MKIKLTLLALLFSLTASAQTKPKSIDLKSIKIDTTITLMATLRNDTLFIKQDIIEFKNWFNKLKVKPKFSFIEYQPKYNGSMLQYYKIPQTINLDNMLKNGN